MSFFQNDLVKISAQIDNQFTEKFSLSETQLKNLTPDEITPFMQYVIFSALSDLDSALSEKCKSIETTLENIKDRLSDLEYSVSNIAD